MQDHVYGPREGASTSSKLIQLVISVLLKGSIGISMLLYIRSPAPPIISIVLCKGGSLL